MHDKNGRAIKIGDRVKIEGTVIEQTSSGNGTYCSINVEVDGDWDGKGNKGKNWFSAKQVEVTSPEKE